MQTTARLSQRLRSVSDTECPRAKTVCEVRMVLDMAERAEAARLVERLYGQEGYLDGRGAAERASMPLFSIHHLFDEACVFTAWQGARLIGALTVIFDSPAGLPMDALYREENDALRAQDRKLCEFCSLALDPELEGNANGALLELFRVAYRFSTYAAGATDVCVTLKPTHVPFYRRICFQQLGGLRLDGRFARAETVAMRLPHEIARSLWQNGEAQRPSRRLQAFFSRPFDAAEIETWQRTARLARRSLAEIEACVDEQPHLVEHAGVAQRAHFMRVLEARRNRAASDLFGFCVLAEPVYLESAPVLLNSRI